MARKKRLFILEIKTGISFRVEDYREAMKWTGKASRGSISNSVKSGYIAKERYAIKRDKFTKEEKDKYFNSYWEKQELELSREKWGEVAPGLIVSTLGRIKINGAFVYPSLGSDKITIKIMYKGKYYNIIRKIIEVHKVKRPLKRNEIVFRNGFVFDYDITSLKLGTLEEYRRRGARTRSQEIAKLGAGGEVIEIYSSIREAAKENFLNHSSISVAIKEDRLCSGMKFVKMDNLY